MSEKIKPFQLSSEYYDLLYGDKNYELEANYIIKHLNDLGLQGRRILEFGCGTGKHAIQFIKKGYDVSGIDISQEMVSIASNIKKFDCCLGDIRKTKLKKKFDVILSLFHVMSYQITNRSVNEAMKNAYENLDEEGFFFFDIWYAPAVLSIRPEKRLKQFNSKNFSIKREANPELISNKNMVKVNYNIEVEKKNKEKINFSEIHEMRYFSIPEIEMFANCNGFELIEANEWMNKKTPSDSSWCISISLKKI